MAERNRGKAATEAPGEEFIEPSKPVDPDGLHAELERVERHLESLREAALQRIAEAEQVLQEARADLDRLDGMLGRRKPGITAALLEGSTARQNAPRGHWHGVVGGVLQKHPGGVRKRDMIDALGIRGDARQEARLSSALQLMKKSGHITQGEDGRYSLG